MLHILLIYHSRQDSTYKQQVQDCCNETDGVFEASTCTCCFGCDCWGQICEAGGFDSNLKACQKFNEQCTTSTTSPWITTTTSCGGTECECLQVACERVNNPNDPVCIRYNEKCVISTTSMSCETLLDEAPTDDEMCQKHRDLYFECCRDAGGVYEYDAEICYCCMGPGCTPTTSTIITTTSITPGGEPCCDETIP